MKTLQARSRGWLLPEQVPEGLKEMLGPDAPDVCIEAVGFHYMNSWLHKIENALMLETDTSEILNEIIYCCRKVSPSHMHLTSGPHCSTCHVSSLTVRLGSP